MTEPVHVGAVLTNRAAARSAETELEITRCWDALAALLETGVVSEARFAILVAREPDDDAHPLVRAFFAAELRRALARPGDIGVDYDVFATYRCPDCYDRGWVYDLDDGTAVTAAKPCRRCNHRQYERWLAHWSDPKHTCSECDGSTRGRRRGLGAGPSAAEEREDQRAENREADLDELI